MEDQTTVQINIARYRCLLHGPLDEYMRWALSEMLFHEEAKFAQETTHSREPGRANPAGGARA